MSADTTVTKTFATKVLAALGATACIAAATIIAPSVASAQDYWILPPVPDPIYTPLAVAEATRGAPIGYRTAYYHPSAFPREPQYPAYPGFPVAYYYDDTYIYAGPARVPVVATGSDWLPYCSNRYRTRRRCR
jgi:hypothetical protein